MIRSVDIYNFQSHADTHLDFSPGVNVLVGKSNEGKSASLRSILWVITNRPLGSSFVRHGQDDCSVTIRKTDDVEVIRAKGKDGNTYALKTEGSADPVTFTAFGSDPPPQVVDALNITDTNIQRQFQPYFLVFDSPGQVAEHIRRVTKLYEIDIVIDLIQKDSRKNQSDIEAVDDEKSKVKSELDELSCIDLGGLNSFIERYKRLQAGIKFIKSYIQELRSIVLTLNELDAKAVRLPKDVDIVIEKSGALIGTNRELSGDFDVLMDLVASIADLEESSVKVPNVSDIMGRYHALKGDRGVLLDDIKILGSITNQLRKVGPIIKIDAGVTERSRVAVDKYNKTVKEINDLDLLLIEIDSVNATFGAINADIDKVTNERMELAGQLTECPTCGSELTDKMKSAILKSL